MPVRAIWWRLNMGVESIVAAQHAHSTLEHAMKALISSRNERYPSEHDLIIIASQVRRTDRGKVWRFATRLEQP